MPGWVSDARTDHRFRTGVGLLQLQSQLPGIEWYVVGLVLAGLLAFTAWKFWQPFLRVPLLLTCGAWLGFLWAASFALYYLDQELPAAWEGHDVTVIGTVADLPSPTGQGCVSVSMSNRWCCRAGSSRPSRHGCLVRQPALPGAHRGWRTGCAGAAGLAGPATGRALAPAGAAQASAWQCQSGWLRL
jgi:hypothetical protein